MTLARPFIVAVLLATVLPAQPGYSGERPLVVGQPTPQAGLSFVNLGYHGGAEDLFLTPGNDPTKIYGAASGSLVPGGPHVVQAFRYNAVTGVATPLDHYNAIRQNGDRNPTVSRDERLTTFTRGTWTMLAERASPTDPWNTPVVIQGLSGIYSPYLTQIDTGARRLTPALVVCRDPLAPKIQLFQLDPALAIAVEVATFRFQMQRLGDYWQFAAPIEDPLTHVLVAMMLCYRQGFPNNGSVLHHLAGVDGKSPVLDVIGAAGNVFTGGSMMWGGSFLAVSRRAGGVAPSWVDNAVRIDMVFATAASIPASGGLLVLRTYSPPGMGFSAIAIGFAASAGTPFPNGFGNLGLQPGFVVLVQATPANGVAQWIIPTGSLIPAQLMLQALWAYLAVYLGGTGRLCVV